MIYTRTMNHPEYGPHYPMSKWTKNLILHQIGGRFRAKWLQWTLEDLKTILLEDGYQHAGTKRGDLHGHSKLYCINVPKITMIESAWAEEESQ